MLANLARGMALVMLGLLIVAYAFSGEKREAKPPVPDDRIVGYYNA
jgi:hypothetical protein